MKTNIINGQYIAQQEEFKTLMAQNKKMLQEQFKSAIEEANNATARDLKYIESRADLAKQLKEPIQDTFIKTKGKETAKKSGQILQKALSLLKKV